jgi:hypothetical protein
MEEFQDPDEWEFGGDDEELFDLLQASDKFSIPAIRGNAKGVQFYILQCQQPKFMVREAFQCVRVGEFDVGDFVVARTYYQKWGKHYRDYVF